MKRPISFPIDSNKLDYLRRSKQFPLLNTKYLDDVPDTAVEPFDLALKDYPKFKNTQAEDLIKLRLMVHQNELNERFRNWQIKLLRYIEINYANLKTKERSYGRPVAVRVILFNQLLALFVEIYLHTGDLLYFNTALKVADLKWAAPANKSPKDIYLLREIKEKQIEAILNELTHG
ncbi:MAG: hypothetical protein GYB31_08270 [Bacteroidetes bacterium]|nr:hypothetical protein [Bacteroidota bacterium]